MINKEKAVISTVGQLKEAEKIIVKDINEHDESEDKGDFVLEFPYKIDFEDSKGELISSERTQRTMKAKNWDKKFYFNDKGFPVYTRDHALLAICEIKKKKTGKELPKELDLNSFVGFEFDGVVVRLDNGNKFIDWVSTFKENGIDVPESENSSASTDDAKVAKTGAW